MGKKEATFRLRALEFGRDYVRRDSRQRVAVLIKTARVNLTAAHRERKIVSG